MNSNTPTKNEIELQLRKFLHGADALMLATVNGKGLPEASYAPYVEYDGCYYIFISELASHTANLKQSGVVSVMFMERNDDGHAFARKRLTCHCRASAINRGNSQFESIMQLLEKQFGNLIATLRGLKDFQLFQLDPVKGNFVAGFGQAFEVDFPLGGDIRQKKPE